MLRLQFGHDNASKFRALRVLVFLSLWILLLTGGLGSALAEKADRDKPMNIESDLLQHDDLKQVSVFSGKVVVTKGSIVMRGERIEVRQDPQGYQYGIILPEPGKRAFYRQKREGQNEYMEGEAERIEYDGRADRVILMGRAELRRYRGTVLSDEMSGQLISYDNLTDKFRIDGQLAGESPRTPGAAAPGSRVRAVLTPRSANGDAK